MAKRVVLSEAEVEKVNRMRLDGVSWNSIGRALGKDPEIIRCRIDPEYEKIYLEKKREYNRKRYRGKGSVRRPARDNFVRTAIDFNPVYDPLRDGPLYHDSMTAALMGDPPVGRSALDKKRGTYTLGGHYADD